jgi:hypothetical protein
MDAGDHRSCTRSEVRHRLADSMAIQRRVQRRPGGAAASQAGITKRRQASGRVRYATKRTFQQYWRSPAYINSKALLTIGAVSPRVSHYIAMIRELILVTVNAHRVLLLYGEQHPTGSPEPDVWRSRLPFRGHIAHPPNHSDFHSPTRALRSKVRSKNIHAPLTSD